MALRKKQMKFSYNLLNCRKNFSKAGVSVVYATMILFYALKDGAVPIEAKAKNKTRELFENIKEEDLEKVDKKL